MAEKLRAIRHEHVAFDGRFFERSGAFAPIARAASVFADAPDWPDPPDYIRAFVDADPVVRFETSPPKRRRDPGPIVREELYDAVIVRRCAVPTRARMWHDYLNALVWATFPRAKLALHRRQHAAIERWIPEGATQLPNARTREMDTLALVDEGGALVLGEHQLLFGHALFESLVLGQPAMAARAVVLSATVGIDASTTVVDALLAERLDDTGAFLSPDELPRRAI